MDKQRSYVFSHGSFILPMMAKLDKCPLLRGESEVSYDKNFMVLTPPHEGGTNGGSEEQAG